MDVPHDTDLPTSLRRIFAPFLAVGATIGAALKLKVKVGYEYALSTDSQGNPLVATIPILLVDGVELSDQASLDQFVRNVNNQSVAWMTDRCQQRDAEVAYPDDRRLHQPESDGLGPGQAGLHQNPPG